MKARTGRLSGAIVQGLILGMLLSLALIKFLSLQSGARIFRYEGY